MKLSTHLLTVMTGLAGFMTSILWYSPFLLGGVWSQHTNASIGASPAWKFALLPLREIVTAYALLFLLRQMPRMTWFEALWLAGVLWLGFYAVQLAGAVLWDGRPLALGLVHSGDWLVKLLLITVLLSRFATEFKAPSRPS